MSDALAEADRRQAEDTLACFILGARERVARLSAQISVDRSHIRTLEHLWTIRHTLSPDEIRKRADDVVIRPLRKPLAQP